MSCSEAIVTPRVTPSGAAASLFLAAISSVSEYQYNIGDPSIYPADKRSVSSSYDFIIVGGGTAGCVVANRLSKNSQHKVLLIEAGADPPYSSEVPGLAHTLANTEADWGYTSDGKGDYCLGMVDKKCKWSVGKALGGSTTLNSMVYLRGNPKDFESWAEEGNKGWHYDELLKYFKKSEGLLLDDDEGHLLLEDFPDEELTLLAPLTNAAKEVGNLVVKKQEVVSEIGYFYTSGTIANGTRYSAAKAYLAPASSRANLHVLKNAHVLKLLFSRNKRAVGVEYEKNGEKFTVKAQKEIVITAGTFSSAQLLLLSGIGPREQLQKLGIKVVANLPVGKHMQGHIKIPAIVASINRGVEELKDFEKEKTRTTLSYLLDKKGKLAGIGYGKLTGFIDSTFSKECPYPDNQIKFDYYSKGDTKTLITTLNALGYNEKIIHSYVSLLKEADLLVITPSIQHPKSQGQLRLASKDPREQPKIIPNFFAEATDEQTLLGGIAEALRLLKTCSLKSTARVEPRVLLKECLKKGSVAGKENPRNGNIDDSHLLTVDYWRCAMRKVAAPDFLPVGTCKMGPSRKDSVVDSHLRVHSVSGLRIVDASIMPKITTGETIGAAVAVAEKGAALIKADWKS